MSSARQSVDICNCIALRKATRRVTQLYDRQLAAADLTANQFGILAELSRQQADGIELWKLADLLVLERSALARNLRVLERDALVTVGAPKEDMRRRQVVLTAAGAARLTQARAAWQSAQNRFTAVLGLENSRLLRLLLAAAKSVRVDLPSKDGACA